MSIPTGAAQLTAPGRQRILAVSASSALKPDQTLYSGPLWSSPRFLRVLCVSAVRCAPQPLQRTQVYSYEHAA
jgi:hypothetical protein